MGLRKYMQVQYRLEELISYMPRIVVSNCTEIFSQKIPASLTLLPTIFKAGITLRALQRTVVPLRVHLPRLCSLQAYRAAQRQRSTQAENHHHALLLLRPHTKRHLQPQSQSFLHSASTPAIGIKRSPSSICRPPPPTPRRSSA